MRILVLSKRQYTNLDLIDDRFGRLRELPLGLAGIGQEVRGLCLSYRPRDEGRRPDIRAGARVDWESFNLRRLPPWGSGTYWKALDVIDRDFRPDLVWACSDMFHAVLAGPVARRMKAALVIDLYDNFESFPAARIPGLRLLFRRALRRADGITCVSRPLAEYVRDTSACRCPVAVIENAVPAEKFRPLDKTDCRRGLGLPAEGLLIGTAGAISHSRGISALFAAFEQLARQKADAHLVLAGTRDKGVRIPENPRIHYLGMLPPATIPVFLSALDISVICNRASAFGRYCFPQKFYESIACGRPIVAAKTGVLEDLLKNYPDLLFEPENGERLLQALHRQIEKPLIPPIEPPSWTQRTGQLNDFFISVFNRQMSLVRRG